MAVMRMASRDFKSALYHRSAHFYVTREVGRPTIYDDVWDEAEDSDASGEQGPGLGST